MNDRLLSLEALAGAKNMKIESMSKDVVAAQRGCLDAFERLVNATRNTVTSVALSIVKDIDISEDIAQQAYINCWNNLKKLKNTRSFLPWLRQSTRYMAINYLRDNKVSEKVVGEDAEQILAQLNDDSSEPELEIEHQQKKQAIMYLLGSLPDETREVITLYYREQQSTAQVAQLLGLTEANVRKKLSRARTAMKQKALARYGKMLVLTAPSVSFSSVVISSLTFAPEASASMTLASSQSWWSKLSMLFSGAVLGAASAIIAILWSHKKVQQKVVNKNTKQQLNKLKYISIVWVSLSALALSGIFYHTAGTWGAIAVYGLFSTGLYIITKRIQWLARIDMEANPDFDTKTKHYQAQQRWGMIGLYGGVITGFASLLFGLCASGRF